MPADHQDLLEDLRRLRQRVELARMHAARHEVVARAFRRRLGQDRRLDFPEALLVEILADGERDPVTQADIAPAAAAGADRDSDTAAARPRRPECLRRSETAAFSLRSAAGTRARALRPRRWRASGLTVSADRRSTSPRTPMTYSGRNRFACASSFSSSRTTICETPSRSRISMKSTPPRSRTRCTQPRSVASVPRSSARSSPQVCVRFQSPSCSAMLCLSERCHRTH